MKKMRQQFKASFSPKLSLTDKERQILRRLKIRLKDLSQFTATDLCVLADFPLPRAQELISLCLFQTLSSVGPATAQDLYDLDLRSLDDLKKSSPTALYKEICHKAGHRLDPCVEDVFRCAVAQARDQNLDPEKKNWWYWSDFRGQP